MTKEEIQAKLQDLIEDAEVLVKEIGTEVRGRVRSALGDVVDKLNEALDANEADEEEPEDNERGGRGEKS